MDYGRLDTEKTNARSEHLDQMSALEIVTLMNELDAGALAAVRCSLSEIARVAEEAAARIPAGGRLIYMGAGTSGRLGVLDASECPPTFGVPDGMVVGIMPVVGIPLPFISYGGSATIVNFIFLGIVLNVSMRRFSFKM